MLKIEVPARILVLLLLAPLLYWTFQELWPVILLVLISFILMLGLLPYVEAMVRRGIPRVASVLLLLVTFIVGLIALFGIMVPAMVEEVDAVRDNLPESAREIEELLDNFGIEVELEERARDIDWDEVISGRAAVDLGQRAANLALSILTVIAITAYLLAETPRLGAFVGQFIPPERKPEAERFFWSLTRVVGGFLRGQAITSLAIGIFTFVLLRIVGVPNPLGFALLAAFADIIPLVGALIATVPPVAAALQESSTKALIVLIALLGYQQFEDRFLVPRVYGRTLNLPPLIVLIAVLAGAELLGITGVLLALPLTAAGRVALDYILENRKWLLTTTLEEQPYAPDIDLNDMDMDTATGPEAELRRREAGTAAGQGVETPGEEAGTAAGPGVETPGRETGTAAGREGETPGRETGTAAGPGVETPGMETDTAQSTAEGQSSNHERPPSGQPADEARSKGDAST